MKTSNKMRRRIYNVIEVAQKGDKLSYVYDLFMMITIVFSIIPLAFKTQTPFFTIVDQVAVVIFIVDYILRLLTADMKYPEYKRLAFLVYPVTPLAIIDLLSILPSLSVINSSFRLLKLFRLFRTFRVFRTFKLLRYSKNITIIINVFKKQRRALMCVGSLAVAYIVISALVIFNIEPASFDSFFAAIYWATVSLTTVGYGDIYPITTLGRIVTMVSAIFGIAIVALPAGIITAGYMNEISEKTSRPETEDIGKSDFEGK
jgi:voltage-gated potassium channel